MKNDMNWMILFKIWFLLEFCLDFTWVWHVEFMIVWWNMMEMETIIKNLISCVNGGMMNLNTDCTGYIFVIVGCCIVRRIPQLIPLELFDWRLVDWIRPFFGGFCRLGDRTFLVGGILQLQKLSEAHQLQLVGGIGGRFVLWAKI